MIRDAQLFTQATPKVAGETAEKTRDMSFWWGSVLTRLRLVSPNRDPV